MKRNYRFFFMFVFSTTLLCLYVHGFCWVYIKRIMDGEQTSILKAMAKTPASIVLIVYTCISVWFVGGLTIFHLYLVGANQSTYENFRYWYDRRVNPFNKGVLHNFLRYTSLVYLLPRTISGPKWRENPEYHLVKLVVVLLVQTWRKQ